MDKKYQDLKIYNHKDLSSTLVRKIEIKLIVFTENEIIIDYIRTSPNKVPMRTILAKEDFSIFIY